MKFWKEKNRKNGQVGKTAINRKTTTEALEYIKRGYLPDWNYSTRKVVGEEKVLSLPDEYYPIHMAVSVAIKALQQMPDSFFEELDREEDRRQEKMEKDLEWAHKNDQ